MAEKDKTASLSNVSPPSELPNFVLQSTSKEAPKENQKETKKETTFVPAIPFEEPKNPPIQDLNLDEVNDAKSAVNALSPILSQGSSALFDWMKDTMKSGVQKVQTSVDTLVTTLDPQMKEYICKYFEKTLNFLKIKSIIKFFRLWR